MIRNRAHARLAMLLGEHDLVHEQTHQGIESEWEANEFWAYEPALRDLKHAILFQAGVSMSDLDEAAVRRGLAAMGRRR